MEQLEFFEGYWAYALTVLLFLIGLHAVLLKRNLLKKLIGMNIFQNAIILFFIVHAYKEGASVPVWSKVLGDHAAQYVDPVPHGLMLTAIVVSVATSGVAMALLSLIHKRFGTIEEDELLAVLRGDREEVGGDAG